MVKLLAFLAVLPVVAALSSHYVPPERENAFYKVHGTGTTNPSKYFFEIFKTMQNQSPRPIKFTYDATGSGTGRKNFANNALYKDSMSGKGGGNDFSCSELPLDTTSFAKLGASVKVLHIPFNLGAIAVFHTVPGLAANEQINLDQSTLGKIFSGQITTWGDDAIANINTGWSPQTKAALTGKPITVYHRTKGSSSTGLLTEFMMTGATATADWPQGQSSSFPQCTATQTPAAHKCWFKDSFAVSGSGGMAAALEAKPYSIGYLDAGHGRGLADKGLVEAYIKNKSGKYVASKDLRDAGLQAAASASTAPAGGALGDWSTMTLVNQAGDNTWPITTYSYFLLRKDLSGIGERGSLVKQLIQHVLGEGGQALLAKYNFAPVPLSVKNIGLAGLEMLTLGETTCSDHRALRREGSWAFDEHSDTMRVKVYASGTTNPKRVHWETMSMCTRRMAERHTNVRLQYDAIGSGPGREEFVNAGSYYGGEKVSGVARPASPVLLTINLPSTKKVMGVASGALASDFVYGDTVTVVRGNKEYTATVSGWALAAGTDPARLFVHTMTGGTAKVAADSVTKGAIEYAVTSFSEESPDTGGYSLKYKSDLGCAELPLTAAQRTLLTAQNRTPLHFPMVLGAIGIFHSVPKYSEACTGGCAPAGGLRLSANTLAKIYTGVITRWDDATIASEQVKGTWPNAPAQPIRVYHRIKGSSSTYLTSEYLTAGAGNAWPLGTDSAFPDCTDAAPSPSTDNKCWFKGSFAARGSGNVAAGLEGNKYSIGYLDTGHGQSIEDKGVHEVALFNKDNAAKPAGQRTAYTSKELGSAGIQAAAAGAVLPASHEAAAWEAVSLVNQPGETAWPMVTFSYLIVDENLVTMHSKGALIKSYIAFLMTSEAQKMVTKHRFSMLPQNVLTINQKGLGRIQLADGVTADDFDCSAPVYHSALAHDEGPGAFTKVLGSGTTNPAKFLFNVFDRMYERSRRPIKMTYHATGSTTGRKNFVNHKLFDIGGNAFSASELPLSASDKVVLGETPVLHLPFVLGAIAVFHNVPEAPAGGLKLSAPLLAKIFTGVITKWNHADIKAENGGWAAAPDHTISVVHRIKGSSSTSLLSEYLEKKAGPSTVSKAWTMGVKSSYPQCTATQTPAAHKCWFAGSHEGSGSDGVTAHLVGNNYTIGYLDAGHGHGQARLQEVAFTNKAGTTLTSKQAGAAGIGGAASNANLPASNADWSHVSLVDQAGTNTWPIVSFSYFLLRENLAPLGKQGSLVKSFIEFVLSAEGQEMATKYSFTVVPQKVLDINNAGLARVLLHGGTSTASWALMTPQAQHTTKLYASGTTNPKRIHWHAMKLAEERLAHKARGAHKVSLSYDAIGSGPGREEFANKGDYPTVKEGITTRQGEKIEGIQRPANPTTDPNPDFKGYSKRWKSELGCSELPLSEAQATQMAAAKQGVALHLPLVIGAISFFHNVPEAKATGLRLSGKVLAKIFQRDITTWDHPEIKAENPGFTVPAGTQIKVVHRIKGSSSTALSTEYLSKASGGTWRLGFGSVITWPADTIGARGSGKVSSTLQDTLYSIGYLDSGHGKNDGLSEVFLRNKASQWVTSSTAQVASAAASLTLPKPDDMAAWRGVSLLDQDGANAWPIVTFSYMLVHKDLRMAFDEGTLIKSYLRLLMSEEMQAYVSTHGFWRLPASVVANNLAGINSIETAAGSTAFEMTAPDFRPAAAAGTTVAGATPAPATTPAPAKDVTTTPAPAKDVTPHDHDDDKYGVGVVVGVAIGCSVFVALATAFVMSKRSQHQPMQTPIVNNALVKPEGSSTV
eukprot:g2114.t1